MLSAARFFQRSSLMARQSSSSYSTAIGASTWSTYNSDVNSSAAASTMRWSSVVSSPSSILPSLALLNNELMDSIWNMSSTLKKRRAKMNKHKLNKRRKKMRLKSK